MPAVSTTALLVIDAQVAMLENDDRPHRASETIAVIRDLVSRARGAETPVIFVRHHDPHYDAMRPGQPGFEVHPAFAPLPGETVIDKRACDSFCETPLAEVLAGLGTMRLVIAGMQSEMCIDTACRTALHWGFDVVLAADGHTTWNNEVLTAAQMIEHHNRTLAGMPRPGHSIVVTPGATIAF